MKTAAIVQARMTSTRLPGKIVRPILGKPTLELLIERLRRAASVEQVIVATTSNATDDNVEALCRSIGAGCYRGSEDDVLYALDPRGTMLWSISLGADIDSSVLITSWGALAVGCDDGGLYYLVPR